MVYTAVRQMCGYGYVIDRMLLRPVQSVGYGLIKNFAFSANRALGEMRKSRKSARLLAEAVTC